VTAGPQFKDNLLSFPVSYGLCVQGLGLGELGTNLLPEEMITQRLVRAKKPWAVAGIAALLLGCTVNYVSWFASFKSADLEAPDSPFQSAMNSAQSTATRSSSLQGDFTSVQGAFDNIEKVGKSLVSNVEGRLLWLEVLKAIDASLPKAEGEIDETAFEAKELAKKLAEAISQRTELHIESIDCQQFDDLAMWFSPPVQRNYERDTAGGGPAEATAEEIAETEAAVAAAAGAEGPADQPGTTAADPGAGVVQPGAPDAAAADTSPSPDTPPTTPPAAPQTTPQAPPPGDANPFGPGPVPAGGIGEEAGSGGPAGPGWVIQIEGHHFHNGVQGEEGAVFVRNTLLKNLREGSVMLPVGQQGEEIEVSLAEMGISHPVLIYYGKIHSTQTVLSSGEEETEGVGGRGDRGGAGRPGTGGPGRGNNLFPEPQVLTLRRFQFVVQFCWKPTPPSERAKAKAEEAVDGAAGSIAATDGTSGIQE
jgi:type IV pilus assembly protein PilM